MLALEVEARDDAAWFASHDGEHVRVRPFTSTERGEFALLRPGVDTDDYVYAVVMSGEYRMRVAVLKSLVPHE